MKVFADKGPTNTQETLSLALQRAQALGIKYIVVASNSGETVRPLLDSGLNIVCVTHHIGFRNAGEDEMPAEVRTDLTAKGVMLLTQTHLLAGVERGYVNKLSGFGPAYITAATLRMFGQGTKVAVEIAVMALDAGLIPHGIDVISIGGSGRGADTALIIRPAHSHKFTETAIREFICKPYTV